MDTKDKRKKEQLDFEDWREPKSKAKVIIGTLLILILLEVIGYFSYFYFYLNTSNFIDLASKYITKNINNTMLFKDNLNIIGNLNLANYNLDVEYKSNNKLSNIDLNLSNNNDSILKGLVYKDNNMVYVNSPNLDYNVLKLSLDDEGIINDKEEIKYFLTKIIEYHLEALKEGNLATKIKGINTKEYIIKINEDEQKEALKRLRKLVEKDDKLSKIVYKYKIRDYSIIPIGTIEINVDCLKGRIKDFKIDTDKIKLNGYYENEYYVLKYKSQEFKIYLDEEIKIEHKLGNIIIDRINKKVKGEFSLKIINKEFRANLNIEFLNKASNIEKIDYSNAKDINSLSEEELNKIIDILTNIFEEKEVE